MVFTVGLGDLHLGCEARGCSTLKARMAYMDAGQGNSRTCTTNVGTQVGDAVTVRGTVRRVHLDGQVMHIAQG